MRLISHTEINKSFFFSVWTHQRLHGVNNRRFHGALCWWGTLHWGMGPQVSRIWCGSNWVGSWSTVGKSTVTCRQVSFIYLSIYLSVSLTPCSFTWSSCHDYHHVRNISSFPFSGILLMYSYPFLLPLSKVLIHSVDSPHLEDSP